MVKVNILKYFKGSQSKVITDFNYVWKILKLLDNLMGNFIMVKKLNIFQRLYNVVWLQAIGSLIFLDLSTIYTQPKNLPLLFQALIMLLLNISAIIMNSQLLKNKSEYMEALNWCPTIEKSNRDNLHMKKAVIQCTKIYYLDSD